MHMLKGKAAFAVAIAAFVGANGCRTAGKADRQSRSASAAASSRAPGEAAVPRALDSRLHHVRARIERLVATDSLPSVAVGVAHDGVILWEEGFGLADRQRKVPSTSRTPYLLASITKSITATAVMTLVQRGQLDLDAPIENYLGGIRLVGHAANTREVTARLLMSHSAGFPTHYRVVSKEERMPSASETLGRYGVVMFPPGATFEYSNVGYRTLDVAVGATAGRSYREYVRDEVFAPLGMQQSTFNPDASHLPGSAALYERDGTLIPLYRSDHPGSGDVWASAHDLLRFGLFHVGTLLPGQRAPLTSATRLLMQRDASPSAVEWGLGWMLSRDRGHRVVSHGGGQPGVSTQLLLYPDEKLVVVVLANLDQTPVQQIAQQIASALLPAKQDSANAPVMTPVVSPVDSTSRWVGTVKSFDITEPFAITRLADGDFRATIGRQLLSSIVRGARFTSTEFTGALGGLLGSEDVAGHSYDLTFRLIPQGRHLVGQVTARGTDAIFGLSSFARLERVDELLLAQYAGAYKHGDNDMRTISREGMRLYSQRGTGRKFEMEPVGADLFRLSGSGGTLLRFERSAAHVTAVEIVGGGRAQRVNDKP